ncbi:MAG: RtcB family protein, partial [Sulfurovaceae bacterium]
MDNLTIIASETNWIDIRSVETLKQIARYESVQKIVGLPDLSVGNVPNGMAVLTKDRIYPHLIGGDIGCGMNLYEIALSPSKTKKLKVDKFEKRLGKIDSLEDVELEDDTHPGYNLGTIG